MTNLESATKAIEATMTSGNDGGRYADGIEDAINFLMTEYKAALRGMGTRETHINQQIADRWAK